MTNSKDAYTSYYQVKYIRL